VVHMACIREGRGVYRVLVGKPKGKRLLGRPRCRWEDNIKLDLREIGIAGFGWLRIGSSGRLCEHGSEHSGSIKKAGYFLTR